MKRQYFPATCSLALSFLTLFFVGQTFAGTGAVDPTFGSGGIATVSNGETNIADDVVIQPDGKIIAVGGTSDSGLIDFSLVRFNVDGTPDSTFGTGGKVVTSVSPSIDGAIAVALQTDGKIVAVGYSGTPGNTDIAVARYHSDGTLDLSFDNDGIVVIARQGSIEAATGVVVQTDGKIVVGGYSNTNSGTNTNFFMARFNAVGALDAAFGMGGIVVTGIGNSGDFAKDLLLQNDGKLILAGTSRTGNSGDFAVVRYNSNGSLDPTFGTNGKVVTSLGAGNDDGNAAALQADGKIVVIGISTNDRNFADFAVVRYNADGSLDASFGTGGKVITPVGDNSYAEDVKIQPNGKIIVVGEKFTGAASDIAVLRYTAAGTPDSTFGSDGALITDINGNRDNARGVAIQGSGKLIVAGGSYTLSQPFRGDLVAVRYLAANAADFDFDGDGKADVSVFRQSNGTWYVNQSSGGFTGTQFGTAGDTLAPADYDGDGKTDLGVYRNGIWYLNRSSLGFTGIAFGSPNDIPVPADYDGDGKGDLAVFRPSNRVWYVYNLTTGQFNSVPFGAVGDKPAAGDFDGDGKSDYAVYRPADGTWYLLRSQLGLIGIQFGESTDKPVPADYDGDGKADIAVFRLSGGTWYLNRSRAGFAGVQFGAADDVPAPADYDGDGSTDLAVFRQGTWFLNGSTSGFTGIVFGNATDQPTPAAFVR